MIVIALFILKTHERNYDTYYANHFSYNVYIQLYVNYEM